MILTVTFNPALDYVVGVQNLELGETNRMTYEEIQLGGKGINVSCVLSALEIPTRALGFVAGFTGDKIVEMAEDCGIATDFIRLQNGDSRINVKIKGDVETEINAGGPEVSRSEQLKMFEKLQELRNGDVLILSGSIPKSMPSDTYQNIMQSLSGKGVEIVVDATGQLLLNVLPYKPFFVKPNKAELSELVGKKLESIEDVVDGAKYLQNLGGKNILVSLGKEGAVLLDEYGKIHKTHAIKGKVQNTVGAGDSMVAGFVAGYVANKDYKQAMCMGSACGNATAFSKVLATKEEIYACLKEIETEYKTL
ncbi:MAG: 1-phosphofructokinase [Bacillota bacterium]